MLARLLLLATALVLSFSLSAQVGHPAKGSWSGYLNPGDDATRIRLLIDDHNGELSGVINPGRRAVDMDSVSLDADNWNLVIKAQLPEGQLELNGTLSNLGSWTNRKYIGNYTLDGQSGKFQISLN